MPTVRDALVSFGAGVLAGLCVFLFWLYTGVVILIPVLLSGVLALTVGPGRRFSGLVWAGLRRSKGRR